MPSKYIECVDCKQDFEFTERDQEFFQEKGFQPPKRCRNCRAAKKEKHGDNVSKDIGGYR